MSWIRVACTMAILGACHATPVPRVLDPPASAVPRADPQLGDVSLVAGREVVARIQARAGGTVTIDDDAGFRNPLGRLELQTDALTLARLRIAPGVDYWARTAAGDSTRFRWSAPPWTSPHADYAWVRQVWEERGRTWLWRYSGVKWDPASGSWSLDEHWPHAPDEVGPKGYFTEHTTTVAVTLARACNDDRWLGELADFFVAYSDRALSLSQLRSGALGTGDASQLIAGDDGALTFPWIERKRGKPRIRECELCNAQLLHPAARLLRAVSVLADGRRTPAMLRFAERYTPLLVRDHLLRHLERTPWPVCGESLSIAESWRHQLEDPSCRTFFTDREMWLIATAVELLGAHANDPSLVPLEAAGRERLRLAVDLGLAAVQERIRFHRGRSEGPWLATWFDGDYEHHRDLAHAGHRGYDFPAERQPRPGVGWDLAHAHRIPVFLRSLYDNADALGLAFPRHADLEAVAAQFQVRVFYGDLERPLFRNFFDGSDGWYRVGYHGAGFGYPPAHACDQADRNRPCMTPLALQHWGEIAFAGDGLASVLDAVVTLAGRNDTRIETFRARHYAYDGDPFTFDRAPGKTNHAMALWWIAGSAPERLPGCPMADG